MLEFLKKLLQQLIEFNRNNHLSGLFELPHGIYKKICLFDRIFCFLSIGSCTLKFYGAFYWRNKLVPCRMWEKESLHWRNSQYRNDRAIGFWIYHVLYIISVPRGWVEQFQLLHGARSFSSAELSWWCSWNRWAPFESDSAAVKEWKKLF